MTNTAEILAPVATVWINRTWYAKSYWCWQVNSAWGLRWGSFCLQTLAHTLWTLLSLIYRTWHTLGLVGFLIVVVVVVSVGVFWVFLGGWGWFVCLFVFVLFWFVGFFWSQVDFFVLVFVIFKEKKITRWGHMKTHICKIYEDIYILQAKKKRKVKIRSQYLSSKCWVKKIEKVWIWDRKKRLSIKNYVYRILFKLEPQHNFLWVTKPLISLAHFGMLTACHSAVQAFFPGLSAFSIPLRCYLIQCGHWIIKASQKTPHNFLIY